MRYTYQCEFQLNAANQSVAGGICLLVGLGVLYLMGMPIWNEIRTYTVYRVGACTIQSQELIKHDVEDGTNYEPQFEFLVWSDDEKQLTEGNGYAANSTIFSSESQAREILDRFAVKKTYPCWYDPQTPSKAVLTRSVSWGKLVPIMIPIAFIGAGISMIGSIIRLQRCPSCE